MNSLDWILIRSNKCKPEGKPKKKDHPPVSDWILHLESIAVSKKLMKDTKTPFMTVDVYWAVSKPSHWGKSWQSWLSQLKNLLPELLCLYISPKSFLAATGKILWISPDVSFPSSQHHGCCTSWFYHVLLLPSRCLSSDPHPCLFYIRPPEMEWPCIFFC